MKLKTTVPLHDLGEVNPQWQGILSPRYDDELIQKYIHQQFLDDAATYAQRYQNTGHWKTLLQGAQAHFRLDNPEPVILDIGSGAGNSVFPLLELYPRASLVASDLSAQLLKLLRDFLALHYATRDCQVIQLNCEQLIFEENQFDLVCGGSILHHLLSPEKTVAQCYKVLKPGGVAVFFEPFEIGYQILALGLQRLIEMSASPPAGAEPLRPEIIRFFEAICLDSRVRKDKAKDPAVLAHLDDKWLFTRSYFEYVSRAVGFGDVVLYSINPVAGLFSDHVAEILRLGLQLDASVLPGWALAYLRQLDRHFSPELCQELMFEACVLFRKPGRSARAAAA